MRDLLQGTLLVALSTLACSICLMTPAAQGASYDILMTADGFVPPYLEVTVGDRVYWWNEDYDYNDYHSTTSYSYPWSSGAVPVGYGVYLDTTKTGTFDYYDDWSYSGMGTLVIKPAGPPPPPPPTVISAPNRVDMVYDPGRDLVYITSGSTVLRYQLASDSFLTPYQLSGSLMGIDLSPDGNTLIVADSSATSTNVWVHVIDLTTGQSHQVFFPAGFYESGTFAVAFGSDGAALITSRFAGSGWVPLRRYDPVSGQTTVISGSIRHDSMVSASGDGSAILVAESDISSGPFERYDVASRSFTKTGGDGHFNYECAASRDASLFSLLTSSGTYIYNSNFGLVTNFGAQLIGAAFHPCADAVFFPIASTTFVRAYDTTSWQMLGEFDFQNSFTSPGGHAFGNGRIRISPDGQIIFVTVNGGVSYFRHGLVLPLSHKLVVAGSPGAYGVPAPISYGAYWFPHGTNITLSVPSFVESNGMRVICTGWTGTGSAAGSGTDTNTSFTLLANSTLTWNWTPFAVSGNVEPQAGGRQMVLRWPSLAGKTYDILFSTNSQSGFAPVATDIPATPPINVYQRAVGLTGRGFYRINMK